MKLVCHQNIMQLSAQYRSFANLTLASLVRIFTKFSNSCEARRSKYVVNSEEEGKIHSEAIEAMEIGRICFLS